jgi:hypothetical protein
MVLSGAENAGGVAGDGLQQEVLAASNEFSSAEHPPGAAADAGAAGGGGSEVTPAEPQVSGEPSASTAMPEADKYYKLELANHQFLGAVETGGRVNSKAKKLAPVTASAAAVFHLEVPAGEKKGRYAFFMCDGGYLRADSDPKPIATTAAAKGAK